MDDLKKRLARRFNIDNRYRVRNVIGDPQLLAIRSDRQSDRFDSNWNLPDDLVDFLVDHIDRMVGRVGDKHKVILGNDRMELRAHHRNSIAACMHLGSLRSVFDSDRQGCTNDYENPR